MKAWIPLAGLAVLGAAALAATQSHRTKSPVTLTY